VPLSAEMLEEDTTGPLIPFFRLISYVSVAAMAGVAVVVQVAGWWLGWEPARSIVPHSEEMKPESVIAFVAAALSFWLLRPESRHWLPRLAGYACAAIVIAGGFQDLYDYVGEGLGEHQSLFEQTQGVAPSGDADFRAPETALILLFSGLALGMRRIQWGMWSPYKLLALVPVTLGLYGLVSYAVPSSQPYWTGSFSAMALGTAMCSTLLGIGLLFAPIEDADKQLLASGGPVGAQGRWLLAGAILISIFLGFFSAQANRIHIPLNQLGVVITLVTVYVLWVLIFRFITSLERGARERLRSQRAIDAGREDLRNKEREAKSVIDSAPDAFVRVDQTGAVTRWNPRAEEMFGWSEDEARGRHLTDLIIPPEYLPGVQATLAGTEGSILGKRIPTKANHKDGYQLDVEFEVWKLEEGGSISFNSFLTDISERKELEDQLVAARDEALESAKAKSQFLATMSHEIRTPMNGVIGLTDLLLQTSLDEPQHRYASGIQTAGHALLSVINDILDFSKLEAGKVVLEETSFEPSRLVDEVVDVFASTAEDKGLELIGHCDMALPHRFLGDPTRLRQILLNLTSNALKFTRHGEIIVRITQDQEPGTDTDIVPLRFEVTDTGIGIPAEKRDRLFDPFTQADASTTRTFGGTGLGLAISQRLTEAMGGRIGVDSSPGGGSTFWCVVPLKRTTEQVTVTAVPELNDLRVLIVDDNESNRIVLDEQLRHWGMQPMAVEGGESALEALHAAAHRETPYDLAIVDLNMPGMDGIELGGRITADAQIPSPHLVLLTSSDDPDADAVKKAGFVASLTKPVHRSALYGCLANVMSSDTQPPPAATTKPAPAAALKPQPPTRGNVLVVEDNEINQAVAVGFLAKLGYHADVASDGLQALDMIAKTPYRAVLMDCQMPVMDGYEATVELRRREGSAGHIPVIAMTADALAENRERCIAAGMDDFVSKPISRDAVASVLGRYVSEATASQPAAGNGERERTEEDRPSAAETIRARMEELGGSDPDSEDHEMFVHIATMFIDREQTEIDELAGAIAHQDAEEIQQRAHRMKGSSGSIGATAMAKLCEELQVRGQENRLDGVAELLEDLRLEFDQARDALEAIVNPRAQT
jgi:two-component system sensor histidine kinase/response regulator